MNCKSFFQIIIIVIAYITVAAISAVYTYKRLVYIYPPKIYVYMEHLGGKYAENTMRCKNLDKILSGLKPLVDNHSKAELEAIFCFHKYNIFSETPAYNGPRNDLLKKCKYFSTKEDYYSILPILKQNVQDLNQTRQVFNVPFCQTIDDLSGVIPFLKKNLSDYVIEVYRKIIKGQVIGMVFCYPRELVEELKR